MSIYVYGIVSNISLNHCEGVLQKQVKFIGNNNLYFIYSDLNENEKILLDVKQAIEHEKVISHFLAEFCILPCRFMTFFEDEIACKSWLAQNKVTLLEELTHFEGFIEMGLKIKLRASINQNPKTDKLLNLPNKAVEDYLLKKILKHKQADTQEENNLFLQEVLKEHLYPIAQKVKNLPLHPTTDWNGVFLIKKDKIHDFKQKITYIQTHLLDFNYLISGPWAVYNFIHLHLLK